jgi:tetratricopeptide (TPR) repeat protein
MGKTKKLSKRVTLKSPKAEQSWLQIAQLRAEKCELAEAKAAYFLALQEAKESEEHRATMEALAGLLRLSGEALDEQSIAKWDQELESLMLSHRGNIPPMAWYCKGAVARHQGKLILAQRYFHRFLDEVRAEASEEQISRGWTMLAVVLQQRGRYRRALWLAEQILVRYEYKNFRSLNGIIYLLIGTLYERQQDFKSALIWFKKAHAQFLGEHNWYYHLYVLFGYARIARQKRNFSQAIWYLEMVEKASNSPEFGVLHREIRAERSRLESDGVDLLIDSRKGVVQTREAGRFSIRKQYVLLHILEALSKAHDRSGNDRERGLSKAEIIEYVWKEPYRPEIHDNKLYYNINRLRKIIEPDIRKPKYLLNWREGYRLAPGLRIHYVGDRSLNREVSIK